MNEGVEEAFFALATFVHSSPLPSSCEPGIYHDSGISRHACLTRGQKMQRLEDPHPVLSTSTDLQRKHNRDVVHDGRELRCLPFSLLVTSMLLDIALILIPCTLVCTLHSSMRISFTDALYAFRRFLNPVEARKKARKKEESALRMQRFPPD